MGKELVHVMGYFLPLVLFNIIKKDCYIEAAIIPVLASYYYAFAFYVAVVVCALRSVRKAKPDCYLCKRRYILRNTAVCPRAADIMRSCREIIAVCADFYGELLE